ncbi:hypothetical protein Patl1_29644 [Pistacia atlantica]|uniref:Uncharacterized protein n=1 Tax=Pistacia atlantica TaxID=434234 RepID=A0ACC1ABY0_9ROSI|nr:hypothetical protein Patl1_29644 [Pistacia atlantica]
MNDYIKIINHLVNTPKDVEILAQKGIIENRLWDSEGVSILFHNLKETTVDTENFYYSGLIEDLNAYCKSPWHRRKATLKQKRPKTLLTLKCSALVILHVDCGGVNGILPGGSCWCWRFSWGCNVDELAALQKVCAVWVGSEGHYSFWLFQQVFSVFFMVTRTKFTFICKCYLERAAVYRFRLGAWLLGMSRSRLCRAVPVL